MRLHKLALFLVPPLCLAQDAEKTQIPVLKQSVVITASPVEPSLDRRNGAIFEQTLFSRDDQMFHALDAGIRTGLSLC